MIFKKMMLTGAMTVIASGSSIQVTIALLIVLINMLAVLKLAPFVDDADDWLSFLTSFQMTMTLLGGLLLTMSDPEDPDFDPDSMGAFLIAINSIGFFALALSLSMLHPKVRAWVNKTGEEKPPEVGSTKVVPVKVEETKSGETKDTFLPPQPPPLSENHASMMTAALALFKSGKLSEEAAAKVRVAQEMCRDNEITVEDLIHLLQDWAKAGALTETELAAVLELYENDL